MRISRLAKGAGTIVAAGVLAGLVGGMALGSFATGGHRPDSADPSLLADQVGNPRAAYNDAPADGVIYSAYDISGGPPMAEVKCKGCGPGINERMSRQYAFGYDDRAVQAWLSYKPEPPLTTDALAAEAVKVRNPPSSTPVPAAPATAPEPITSTADPQAAIAIGGG